MYADRVAQISPFRVMQVLQRAGELEAAGRTVVHFEVGEPDFETAPQIVEAGHQALADGRTKYTAATGIEPLREAISGLYAASGIEVTTNRIIITSGASAGLTMLNALLLNPGDELLITDPGYPANEVFARVVGAMPRAIEVGANQGFAPHVDDVEQAWGAETAGVLLASPANPTGTMLTPEVLTGVSDLVRRHDGFFILDEIYQGLTMDASYRTGLQLVDDLFVLNSFSKYFGMTGWRLGWLVVPEDAIDGVTKLAQNLFISPSAPAQYAALAAFGDDAMAVHEDRADRFRARCARLADGLRELGFGIPVMPDGAFYLYVDVSHTGLNSTEFCWRLLDEYHVAVTPGEDFGHHQADRFVRFAYTTGEEAIDLGLERIARALQAWGLG